MYGFLHRCFIQKLFPYGEFIPDMKLSKAKLTETLRKKNQGWTTYQARKIARISIRRVNQVWKEYNETGKIPEIGKNNGRPPRTIEEWELQMVKQAYDKYRVSASTLEKLIERDFQFHLPHRHIHNILLMLGYSVSKNKIDKRKKDWIRYERRHSLTAVHIDWYYDPVNEQWVFAVLDGGGA